MLPSVVSRNFIEQVESIGKGSPNLYNSRYDPGVNISYDAKIYTDCETDRPALYIVTGPGGSGKSSAVVSSGLNLFCGGRMICYNNYERCLSEKDNSMRFAKEQCISLTRSLLEMETTFGIECPCTSDISFNLALSASKKNYRISFVYMAIRSPEFGFGRKLRSGNSSANTNWSEEYDGHRGSLNMLDKFMKLSDEASVFDNSGRSPTLQIIKKDCKYYVAPDRYQAEWLMYYAKQAMSQRLKYISQDIPLFKKD